jgi:hypothetical protein
MGNNKNQHKSGNDFQPTITNTRQFIQAEEAMKAAIACGLGLTLIFGSAPVRADFKYTDTSKITGGSMKSMMKTVSIFSKQASAAMKPIVTTRYVKGNQMRTDHADGTFDIIDLDGRKMIFVDPQKHTYSETTFDEMKAAMEKAQKQMQDEMAKQKAQQKDVKVNVKPKVYITPTKETREIMGQQTNELKMQIDMEMEAQDTSASSQQNGPVSGTMSTTIDSWVAPSVPGYKEIGEFYVRMAKEINWTPPSNISINPQVSQGMAEMQKNSAAYKGLPLLQYMTMTMVGQQGQATAAGSQPPPSNSSSTSSSSSVPTSTSEAMVKGLGGLFNKKKKKDEAAEANANANSTNPPPPSTPGSLMEMTIEVNSFSDSALDASLFAPPAGFTKVARDPDQMFGHRPTKQ